MKFRCKGKAMTGTKRFFPWMHPCNFSHEALHLWFVDLHRSSCRGGRDLKIQSWQLAVDFFFHGMVPNGIATLVEETPLWIPSDIIRRCPPHGVRVIPSTSWVLTLVNLGVFLKDSRGGGDDWRKLFSRGELGRVALQNWFFQTQVAAKK